MSKKKEELNKISLFEGKEIRKVAIDGEWFFSVVDVVGVLSGTNNPRRYWSDLKRTLDTEGFIQLYENIVQLKLTSSDGKKYLTDVADTETILRIIQSVPSKQAEPFKRWLARIGKERLDEIEQPAKAIERARGYYLMKGYTPEWIQTRTASIDGRHTFTDKLKSTGAVTESYQYAILTNELYKSSFGLDANEYKKHKNLQKGDSLRDNMTPLELAATIFSEATSTEIITKTGAKNFVETKNAIHIAGQITKEAIAKIEKQTGKKVVTHENAKALDSPEIRKELIQQSLPKQLPENLSDMNAKLKKALNYNPKDEGENQ